MIMVSMAEQRRFKMSLPNIRTGKLISIRDDLASVASTQSEFDLLEAINQELAKREKE